MLGIEGLGCLYSIGLIFGRVGLYGLRLESYRRSEFGGS